MNIDHYLDLRDKKGISGLFFVVGSFGVIDGDAKYERFFEDGKTIFTHASEKISLRSEFSEEIGGVIVRKDMLRNCSEEPIVLHALSSRFAMDGNEYEVYTQYNGWQHESSGAWQKLVTQITARSSGIRVCDGSAPMMALHNCYTRKNTVFHLMPNCQWNMTVRKYFIGDKEPVVLEMGFDPLGLHFRVEAGETIELPTIIFYTAKNKTDLDAYKLHTYYLEKYPRRVLPVQYNSWLHCFAELDTDDLLKQVDQAADLGIEAFMIDAGWFGYGDNWARSVGDWVENPERGTRGRLREISSRAREKGMIFGLWFEPERAYCKSNAVAVHPDYYIDQTFLDFTNPDAVDYLYDVISRQIEAHQIGWVKFDFNETIPVDPSGCAFYRYMQGQNSFIQRLKERFPSLYITNCASGGYRMELGQGVLCDSFWISDNQGPYEGVRILKDTLKRMPSALIERWNVQKYCEGFPNYTHGSVGKMVHCNDATWDFLIGVDDSFSKEFLKGGPIGFSSDLCGMPDRYKDFWREMIHSYKEEREFFKSATARILVDTESVTVIEYTDRVFKSCMVQAFVKSSHAEHLVIYPVVDENADYLYNGERVHGRDIAEDGLMLRYLKNQTCHTLKLTMVDQ